MSLDPDRLQQALQLFGVEPEGEHDVEKLAELLAVPEEVLPWLAFRANTFAADEELNQALLDSASRASSAGTARPSMPTPSVAQYNAKRELDKALEKLIWENIERRELALSADARLSDLVRMSAAGRSDQPQNSIVVV